MKNKIVLGCFIAASMLAMPSCSDFLTENPKGKLTPENFFSNQNKICNPPTVITAQPVSGSKPNEAFFILINSRYGIVGQSVLHIEQMHIFA